jgi:hypothetical protein
MAWLIPLGELTTTRSEPRDPYLETRNVGAHTGKTGLRVWERGYRMHQRGGRFRFIRRAGLGVLYATGFFQDPGPVSRWWSMSEATAPELVRCSRCGQECTAGERQCSNPKCHCLLPGNPGRRAEVPGLSAAQRGGRDALSEENSKLHEECVDLVVADLGGYTKCSYIEIGLVEQLAQLYVISAMLQKYLNEVSPLSPRGRVRSALTVYHQTVDRYERIATKLGLQRRPGWEDAHQLQRAMPDDIDDEQAAGDPDIDDEIDNSDTEEL